MADAMNTVILIFCSAAHNIFLKFREKKKTKDAFFCLLTLSNFLRNSYMSNH